MSLTVSTEQTSPTKPTIDFKKELSNFIFTSKYARYNEKAGRRETWDEMVDRVLNMHLRKFKQLDKEYLDEIRWAFDMVKQKRVVPSMRTLQFGGKAVETNNLRSYNCSVRHVDSIRSFAEIFYLLLCGCGVGIGLSKFFLSRLPNLVNEKDKTGIVLHYVIEDTIEGWADSLEAQLMTYFKNTAYSGRKIVFDYSRIRPIGTPLKTSGGKAPGYKPLKKCHERVKLLMDYIIEQKKQQHLKPINAYDILMYASDAVLSGGIRRSATIVIFDYDDEEMMQAKTYFTVTKAFRFAFDDEVKKWYGKVKVNDKTYELELSEFEYQDLQKNKRISWFHIEPQRGRSNNSVLLLRDKITKEQFEKIITLTKQFGEPGFIFGNHEHQLYNPCSEIGFVPVSKDGRCGVQVCNLTSINGAKITSKEDFVSAAKAASIIGTLQATYTDFKYLQPVSKQLTEEEALLGVSITGMMDNPDILLNEEHQQEAAHKAVATNKKWARVLGINEAARVTCVKPEGTSSLVLESASGIHPHHAKRYFRRVQCNRLDPVYRYAKSINKHACEESVWSANKTDEIITFPVEISDKAITKKDLSAIDHLKIAKRTYENWILAGTGSANKKPVTHNVSITVIVKETEWPEVIEYLFKNRSSFGAVSFIPNTGDKDYKQAPLEAIVTEEDEKKWVELTSNFASIDYTKLKEEEDNTEAQQTLACSGGSCELTMEPVNA